MADTNDIQNIEKIRALLALNPDSRHYFFTNADERWLEWLWKNGLMRELTEQASDQEARSYQLPELKYLQRMAKKIPNLVVDIVLKIPVTAETPDYIIENFLLICTLLDANQLARVIPKIRDEKWVSRVNTYDHWAFEYKDMLGVLAAAKDSKSLLDLAGIILEIREDDPEDSAKADSDNPFSFKDLLSTEVFSYLANIDSEYTKDALSLALKTFDGAVLFRATKEDSPVFDFYDGFHLSDIDFFTLDLSSDSYHFYQADLRQLAAVVTVLIRKYFTKHCNDMKILEIGYLQHIETLSKSRLTWRLRLFALSQCPQAFSSRIKEALFRIFNYPPDIGLFCPEYEHLVKIGLPSLTTEDKHEYVQQAIEWFAANDHKKLGHDILSCGYSALSKEERASAEVAFGALDETYVPHAWILPGRGGAVISQAPGSDLDWEGRVPEIARLLMTDWAPNTLINDPKNDEDFLRPIDAYGAKEKLMSAMESRPSEFLEYAGLFFNRDSLDAHYTYAFIDNLYRLMEQNKIPANLEFKKVLALLQSIVVSGMEHPFDMDSVSKSRQTRTAQWDSVHRAIADIVKLMLRKNEERESLKFLPNRDNYFQIIAYLLKYHDPSPEDEEIETARCKTGLGGKAYLVCDPYSNAINSVRGTAFQALIEFIDCDDRVIVKDRLIRLSDDVKQIYETTLKAEETRAIMFMFGHYLPSFYFRDSEWVKSLLPQIFPADPSKEHLYLAAWEGYLANNLFRDMFIDPAIQSLYERGIILTGTEDPGRAYFKQLQEGVATHFALAFMYYEEFNFGHPLFIKAFNMSNPKVRREFVSFIGRMFVSGNNQKVDEYLNVEPRGKVRLRELWDWLLESCRDIDLLMNLGYWINIKKDIFEINWLSDHVKRTLEKTSGSLDWDYGLGNAITEFANVAPMDALAIARLYLLKCITDKENAGSFFYMDKEWLEAFKALYQSNITQSGTRRLVNELIKKGGSTFWELKNILT